MWQALAEALDQFQWERADKLMAGGKLSILAAHVHAIHYTHPYNLLYPLISQYLALYLKIQSGFICVRKFTWV